MKAFLLLFLLSSATLTSQETAYLTTLETFKNHFNDANGKAVFEMMDSNMQQQLGIEKVTAIVTTFRNNLGSIVSFKFIERINTSEVYETLFEKGKQNISLSLDKDGKLNGLRFLPASEDNELPKMERNKTSLGLPFKGNWFTVWGGDTKAQNYHVVSKTQRHAFDFLKVGKNNRAFERSGTRNEDYYAFGQPIFAVCDAEVIQVNRGIPDNKPGAMNEMKPLGNSVILKTKNEEYIVYAHFEEGTIAVEEGQQVKKGQYLANCGNSGNSSEPHLHLHIQDGPNIMTSIGVKCFFDNLVVNGETKTDYSPVRWNRISPAED
ncbi:MAG: peptidase M23 [Flavobacteriaceae bacterium]|nr:peptidase M23 [Flavobacteriaceae bacterium]|tara:strand:- start:352 stop:1314 length:963 start_codon:yes stop_codon:yes gene_type:complete